ncbi:YebG family protein [Bowmanella sp. Y26]|uniref:YebG family protein n=1 Tax=Bowmanella yangjiangensis TaxID=2811230 RepID=A0ABS3CSY9_9ALTE|nr:YebG family protein [Bowmanella yangjiangensis]MBN7819271.1 YebG family protein [Bowmanella yangjiangensis]MBT1065957.1 YebG family protein [Bowmanella yangjiangensis]
MAIIIRYVVEHKGVEKLVTTDKKEADLYDKMLDVADNLADYMQAKGVKLEESVMEDLSIMLSQNKDAVARLLKGNTAASLLEEEKAEVVRLEKKQA